MKALLRNRLSMIPLACLLFGSISSCRTVPVPRSTPYGFFPRIGHDAILDIVPIALYFDPVRKKFVAADPKQSVRADLEVAIWIVFVPDPGKPASIQIQWKNGNNPFPRFDCPGNRFCFALAPAPKTGTYPYDATIRYDGTDYPLDPEVEIWR